LSVEIQYRRRDFARILGLTEKQLAEADRRLGLGEASENHETYTPQALAAYRTALELEPEPRPLRRQLFLNFKGGTGKTSLSVAYAYRLAELGHRVLLMDLDSQGHATQHLGFEGEECEHTLYDVLVKRVPLSEAILPTTVPGFDLVPANLGMSTIDMALMPMAGREYKLNKAMAEVADRYEFIVMDAPPSFGLLNLNALIATDDLMVPVLPDFLSFHGLKLLFETVSGLEEDLGHTLQRIFIILNQYNPTTRIAKEARRALETHYPEFLLETIIRQSTKFAQASSEGMPMGAFAPANRGTKDVNALISEVLSVPTVRAEEKTA